jgi:hypothetical protein
VTREGFKFLMRLAAFMDAVEIDQGPEQNSHPLSQTFEFLEGYLPKVKALETPSSVEMTALTRLRAQVEKWLVESESASKRLNGFSRLSVEKTRKRAAQEEGAQAAFKDVIAEIKALEKGSDT